MPQEDNRQTPPGPPVQIEIGEKESEGVYSNFVLIAHSPSEFIIDFARILPGLPKAKVFSRIVMTPQHATLLHNALSENIKKYEARFGQIKLHTDDGEKKRALEYLAEKYCSTHLDRAPSEIAREWKNVCTAELVIEHLTGKAASELIG